VEPTLRTAEPRRDKTEIFNEALKEAHDEPKTEAVTKKAAKPEKKAEEPTPADRSEQAAKPDEVGRADKAHAEAASGEGTSDAETAPTAQTGEAGAGEQAKSDEA
jgi:small subunit ribosomal protein S16